MNENYVKILETAQLKTKISECETYMKENPGTTVIDYIAWFNENGQYYYVNGKRYFTLPTALAALNYKGDYKLAARKLREIRKNDPDNGYNDAFQIWIAKYAFHTDGMGHQIRANEPKTERKMREVLNYGMIANEPQTYVRNLLDIHGKSVEDLMKVLRENPYLTNAADSYNMDVVNRITSYCFDFYVPKCATFPKGALIEIDGSRHTEILKRMSSEELVTGSLRDKIKDTVADVLNIPLLRISVNENSSKKYIACCFNSFKEAVRNNEAIHNSHQTVIDNLRGYMEAGVIPANDDLLSALA